MKIKNIFKRIWSKIKTKFMNEPLGFSCCFCSRSIMAFDHYPADLNIIVNIDKPKDAQHDQFFFCHTECFKDRLHQTIKPYFTLERIEDKNDF